MGATRTKGDARGLNVHTTREPCEYATFGTSTPDLSVNGKEWFEKYKDDIVKNVSRETLPKNFWWNPTRILSYNCLYNFIIGNRGGGKSFGAKEFCIRKAIESEGKIQFLYLRRTEVELKKAKSKFFEDIVSENKFPDYSFRVKGDEFQCCLLGDDGEPDPDEMWTTIGHSSYLSGAKTKKSVPYPYVKYMVFDEFIIPDAGIGSYLPDEVTCFLEFYETVARMRDVYVMFLSNALTMINPYFLYFSLRIPYNTDISRLKKDICIEIVDNPEYKKKKKATRFGQMIAGTEYEKYAIDNEFICDNDSDIAPLDGTFEYFCTLCWCGTYYGVHRSYDRQQIVITSTFDKTHLCCCELTLRNGKINKMMISQAKKYYYLNTLFDLYVKGFVRYASRKVKAAIEPMFQKLF